MLAVSVALSFFLGTTFYCRSFVEGRVYLRGGHFWSLYCVSILVEFIFGFSIPPYREIPNLSAKHIAELLTTFASYRAFSTLVADSQFSTLGVVLLAILARVGKLVGLPTAPTRTAPELKPEPRPNAVLATGLMHTGVDRGEVVERACNSGGSEDRGLAASREESNASVTRMMTGGQQVEDAGDANSINGGMVTRSREDIGELGVRDTSISEAVALGTLPGHPTGVAERRKKRRKKGNAIDELFAGLS
jgi:ribonuclease MRP protein subunit RMP1